MISTYVYKTRIDSTPYGAATLNAGPLQFMAQQYNGKTHFSIEFKFIIREHHRWSYESPANKFSHHDFIRWNRKYVNR